jgi:hypothetical protein
MGLGYEKTPGGTTPIERTCPILSDLKEDALCAGLGQFLEQIKNEPLRT